MNMKLNSRVKEQIARTFGVPVSLDGLHTEEQVSEEAVRELMKEVVHLSELLKNVVPI